MKDTILTLLDGHPWQMLVQYYPTIDSTNNRAKELAFQGAPHGTVLIADQQTGGRGRLGRSFQSPSGVGIYLSVILRPQCHAQELMHLTCAAGVAMCEAVEQAAAFRPRIKWTNDLVFEGRKLGGILTELKIGSEGLVEYAVIGIGINCLQKPEDFPAELQEIAGSLAMFSPCAVDRAQVAAQMVNALYKISRMCKQDIMTLYRKDCMTVGTDVSLVRGSEVRHGHAEEIDDDGGLLVRFPDGHLETVSSGEVSVRGMYGYV